MTVWHHVLNLGDIFHSEDHSFTERRDIIVRRIRESSFYDIDNWDLMDIVDDLANSKRVEDFDMAWGDFYDWADDNRVWVATR